MEKKKSPFLHCSLYRSPSRASTPPFSLLYNRRLATFHEHTHSKVVVLATVWRSSLSPPPPHTPPRSHWLLSERLSLWLAASPASQLSSTARPREQELLHWHSFPFSKGGGASAGSLTRNTTWFLVGFKVEPNLSKLNGGWRVEPSFFFFFFFVMEGKQCQDWSLKDGWPVETGRAKRPHWRFYKLHNIWKYFQKHPVQ